MFSIENLSNASIIIKSLNEKLAIDPWFKDGIYDGTWHNFPRLTDNEKFNALSDVDICMYTHLHKDHFCIDTAKKYFKPSTKFLISKVWGWQVVKSILNKNGFSLTYILECSKDVFESKDFKIMSVPPLNVTGLEAQNENDMSIDSGFSLVHKQNKVKCVFLADDNLYSNLRVNENIELLKNPDLIAFAYSGFASDYPFNYGFSNEKMVEICNEQEKKRFETQVKNLRSINPKCIMPYSSEFVAVGNYSEKWREIMTKIWTSNKRFVASQYASKLGIDGIALYPQDHIVYDKNGKRTDNIKPFLENGPYSISSLLSYAKDIVDKNSSLTKTKKYSDNVSTKIKYKLQTAANNYKKAIEKHNLSPLQDFIICINKLDVFKIDKKGNFVVNFIQKKNEPFLKLDISHEFLERLLEGNLHWDDACLSMKLSWHRSPNIFCSDTSNAINYLKI